MGINNSRKQAAFVFIQWTDPDIYFAERFFAPELFNYCISSRVSIDTVSNNKSAIGIVQHSNTEHDSFWDSGYISAKVCRGIINTIRDHGGIVYRMAVPEIS